MRCLTVLVFVLLIAVVCVTGYNYLQVSKMSRDMSEIKAAVQSDSSSSNDEDNLTSTLASASQHARRAKELLAKGKTKSAKIELDKSLKAMNKASKLANSKKIDTSKKIGDTISKVQKQFEETLDTFAKESEKKRPERD